MDLAINRVTLRSAFNIPFSLLCQEIPGKIVSNVSALIDLKTVDSFNTYRGIALIIKKPSLPFFLIQRHE